MFLIYIYVKGDFMGRLKKYITLEEQRIAKNKRRMKYYWSHQQIEQKKNLRIYYENKRNI